MVSKTLFNTLWFVFGKEQGERGKIIDKAWLRSILPPYFAGHGYAIRLGSYSLRFGVCTPLYNDVDFTSELDVARYVTMGSNLTEDPSEIGEWGCSEEEPQATETQQDESE